MSKMKIINIESSGDGYKGLFTEDYRQYNRFNISPTKHQVIPLRTPSDISSYEEFIETWEKCGSGTQFMKFPIEIKELTIDALRKVETRIGM